MASINVALTAYPAVARYARPEASAAGSNSQARYASKRKLKARQNAAQMKQPESSSLDQIICLAQAGDAAAFEEIYRLHSRRVYALCLRMSGSPADAEDLAQDAFLQLFRKIHTFRGESAFSSWLHRLTANVVLMRFRKKKPVTQSLDEISRPDDEKGGIHNEIGGPDLRLRGVFDRFNLDAAIGKLPEGYKAMFVLHDIHGYEHNEIAEILGCSIGNSKSQLHKARKRLRQLLRKAQTNRRNRPRAHDAGLTLATANAN